DNGNVWLVDNEMRLVENWDEVTPPLEDETEEGDEKSSIQSFEDTLAERTETNRPPVANDDDFGVRPGRTTILPVIENDSDPDGDVLTITKTSEVAETVGILDLIDGGRALQYTPAEGASNGSFSYTIDDGRGGIAEAYVTVRVVPEATNNPPIEKRTTSVGLEVGGTIDQNVLTDWIDPDGDDLTLIAASPVSGDEVRFTPDGFITFQSRTSELGEKEVRLTVSDGTAETTGTFIVDVAAAGTLKPIGTPDFAEAFVNEEVVLDPTVNDLSLTTAKVVLLGVDKVPDELTVVPNLDTGELTISGTEAGTYYLLYSLGAGVASSTGLIRVDIKPDPDGLLPPIAVKDTAYLRAGEPTVVSVLGNDVSPNGLVLAVQSVDTTATNASLTVEVLNNTEVRISSSDALSAQTQFTYTISDGVQTAVAGVTVVPVAPIVNRQPPVAVPDTITVRADDYVSVDVLDNDYHPDDSAIVLEPELAESENAGEGALVFINDQKIRYQAPGKPGDYSVIYRIADQYGESATASLTFSVTAKDLDTNEPPAPQPQYARVFSGASVPITIPLDGIDPNGDSVVVTTINTHPTKGDLSGQTPNSFVYTSHEGEAGTDEFRYVVEDTYGEKAIGIIYVGVVPRGETSEPPNAIDDSVEIRPGRTASVRVLDNDSDPAGYPLAVTELPEVDEGITAEIEDNEKVVITAPDTEGAYTIRYQVDNGQGGIDTAFIMVNVTEDAEPLYPVATDYYVTVDEVLENDQVVVDLDGLIANPGGRDSELLISGSGPNGEKAEVDQDAQTITVVPGELRIAIAYTVTNEEDNLSTTAFIIVPPAIAANAAPPPYLKSEYQDEMLDMNATGEWKLSDIIEVPSGRPAIITEASTVTATHSNGDSSYVDEGTIRITPAQDFRGVATITFEVTDGKDADDLNGNKAVIAMSITVGNPDFTDTPPSFTAQNITIEAGEDPSVVDLRASTTHQNPSLIPQFSYEGLTGVTNAISASISGGELTVSSPRGSKVGTKTVLSFTVNFREFEVPGTVTVTTVASTKPPAQAVTDEDKGRRGAAQPAFNVLANDYNPFAATNEPLTLVSAVIENAGESGASMSFTKDGTVKVSPGSSFIGTISVLYTLQDATLEESRQKQGRYLLTVRDAPDKITPAPTATPGDMQATVTWTTPGINGEPITGYTVTWTPAQGAGGGTANLPAGAASHTVTGLTNGTDYRFRVTATNVMGTSTVSDQSNAARPLGQATPPTTVSMSTPNNQTGNGQVNMSWGGAGANGGNITGYTYTVYSGNTAVHSATTTGTSASWTGNVGTAYTFSVVALATGGDSNPSARSGGATPAPGKPSVALSASSNPGNYTLNASYGAAAANGASPSYSWTIGGLDSGSGGPQSFSRTGSKNTSYTLTVTVTVGGVSNSASATARTPDEPVSSWQADTGVGTCPEKGPGYPSHYTNPPPRCSSAHDFARGTVTVYCKTTWSGWSGTWYLFSGSGYSKSEGWYLKGDTITISGSPGNC
ncbi:MAG: Ig-like domain-containing protein, partial [Aeromicrobium sp.]